MPGIFGCLTIDPDQRLDAAMMDQTYEIMTSRLRHTESYASDRKTDPDGRWMVGRIGHQNLMGADMRYSDQARVIDTRFYGIIAGNQTSSNRTVSGTLDPLLGISSESGYFSAFCIDDSQKRLALVVDRRASEPIFYIESGGVLYFAPEVKALIHLGVSPGDVNVEGLASFLGSGYLLPHQTLFTNVKKLTSRHALVIADSHCREFEYWKYEPGSKSYSGRPETMQEELAEIVRSSILGDFGKPKDTITFLSGGLDSRYILACIARANPEQASSLHAVTWAEQEDIPQSDPEVAAVIARELGIRHQFKKRCNDEYETWFKEANYLLDGHSDVSAEHPHEFQIMKALHQQGFNRVIRGDEALGLRGKVFSPEAALANIEIRPFSGIQTIAKVMHRNWYERTCAAGDESFSTLTKQGAGMDPVDFKDVCYFSLRAPTYLSSAAYYKQILFDHRNPLLANEILDFYERVPIDRRLNKKLFFQAFDFAHPDLAKIPYSTVSGTEDWGILMATDTPLRKMIRQELADDASSVWEIFDRHQVVDLFNNISIASGTKNIPAWKQPLRKIRDFATVLVPSQMGQVALQRAQAKLRVSQLMFRIMIFKNWHDTFYTNR